MGASSSKEEILYQAVQNGNQNTVKSLHREGTSLEWVDKEGRTPLMVACSHGDLFDMVVLLLQLGANMDAFRSGTHGGFAIHHAAKRGLEKTVGLLVSYGANPLAVNDDGQTALEMARSKGHTPVVRLLEEKICIFSGILRELSGFSILESLAPNLITRKVWAVILPSKLYIPGRAPVYELAIYDSPKVNLWNGVPAASAHPAGLCNVAQPQSVIQLTNAIIVEPNFTLPDPVLFITDKVQKTKHKLLSENKGDSHQLRRLYETCQGICLVNYNANPHPVAIGGIYQQGNNLSQIHPVSVLNDSVLQGKSKASIDQESISEGVALALALDESIRTAREEGISISPTLYSSNTDQYKGWEYGDDIPGVPLYTSLGFHDFNEQLQRCYNESWSGVEAERAISSSVDCVSGHQTMESNSIEWISSDQAMKSSSIEWVSNDQAMKSSGDDWIVSDQEAVKSTMSNDWVLNDQEAMKSSASKELLASPSAPPLIKDGGDQMDMMKGGLCVVCLDACAEGVCIPCGHLAGCMICLTEIQSKQWGCPVCRGSIERVVKVYAV